MEILSLYEMCLRKVDNNLRDGIYRPCRENPFNDIPPSIVDNIASLILERQSSGEFRADDLELLLTCGNLKKLEISVTTLRTSDALFRKLQQVLNFLRTGCQKLETFHFTLYARDPHDIWFHGSFASNLHGLRLEWEVSEALENVIRSSPNLEDFHCRLSFDLKALRSCRKLRSLRLHFYPQQRWHEFLEEENDQLKTHEFLQFFTVCKAFERRQVPYDDVAIVLQYCPNLTSLGFIESSGALSQLYRMNISCELKLRSCFWACFQQNRREYSTRMTEAVMKYPMIEELECDGCCLSVPHLKVLKNLAYLIINLDDNVSDILFNDLLQEIGPQLKCLFFRTNTSMDISLLLQNCLNLESLRIDINGLRPFTNPSVSLTKLKHLTLDHLWGSVKKFFKLLSNCNELTEFFLFNGFKFDDETLNNFVGRNCLSNLKVAYFDFCKITENGFREFLKKSPNLEKVSINSRGIPTDNFESVVSDLNRDVLCIGRTELKKVEFFQQRKYKC